MIVLSHCDNEQERIAVVVLHGGMPGLLSELTGGPAGRLADAKIDANHTDSFRAIYQLNMVLSYIEIN